VISQNKFVILRQFLVISQNLFVNSDGEDTSLAAQADAEEPICPSTREEDACEKEKGAMFHLFEMFVYPVIQCSPFSVLDVSFSLAEVGRSPCRRERAGTR
jgi:hypothetical protein